MFRFPPPLCPGDWVAVVAPAGPFDQREFWRGLAWIRDRYRVRASPRILGSFGFLSSDDAFRRQDLARAMMDPAVKAIVAARGGYGALRIAMDLPWDEFRTAPRWMVGFSDITVLHALCSAHGVGSVHGPNVTSLADANPITRAAWLSALERPTKRQSWTGLRIAREGRAKGHLLGGNLALLDAMATAGALRLPVGTILLLEDVGERPYRVDRMLTALRLGGHFKNVCGIVLGDFARCDAGVDGVTIEEVLVERLCDLGVPVALGAPFGHGAQNCAIVLGAPATLEGDTLTWGLAED